MKNSQTDSPINVSSPQFSALPGVPFSQRPAALERIEQALDEGLEESFPASDPLAIDASAPENRRGIKDARYAARALDLSCIVEFDQFLIELNAEQRNNEWFPSFQIFKGNLVAVPWTAPTVPASSTKKMAIEVGTESAVADLRGGRAAARS